MNGVEAQIGAMLNLALYSMLSVPGEKKENHLVQNVSRQLVVNDGQICEDQAVLRETIFINPNYPKSIKIHSSVWQDFDEFVIAYEWHHNLAWGLLSKCCPKTVVLCYCTVLDFGKFGTALCRHVKGVRVKSLSLRCLKNRPIAFSR